MLLISLWNYRYLNIQPSVTLLNTKAVKAPVLPFVCVYLTRPFFHVKQELSSVNLLLFEYSRAALCVCVCVCVLTFSLF